MKILAVDPGVTTGVVYYNSRTQKVVRHLETQKPLEIATLIDALRTDRTMGIDVVVLEDFIGQGPRDINVYRALKTLGFVEGFARYRGLKVELQPPQFRKHMLGKATEMLSAGHHYTDALAHALAYVNISQKKTKAAKNAAARLRVQEKRSVEPV